MSRKYFGTDGVRGRVGEPPLTVDFALRLASAAARALAPNGGKVLVGKDTRLSGYMFEAALEAGFVAAGVDVLMIGPLPTPAIAYLTQKFECDLGVVISASHNPYEDNGIKFFNGQGGKLTDEAEARIEQFLDEPPITRESPQLGTARRVDKSRVHYQQFCSSTIPAGMDLSNLKIVIDCAHGAGYKVAPRTIADLGAEVIPIGCSPNGRNINLNCGSTAPQLLQMMVPGVKADLGIALDGDGDRLVMVDQSGALIDGDQLLYIIAKARKAAGQLVGPVVGTVMSNLGLEHALVKEGIEFKRAKVGDRYVLELLRETGGVLGGETSGHLLCLDKTTTGDALIAALQVLAIVKQSGHTLAQLAEPMPKYPQILENVRVKKKIDVNASPAIQGAVKQVEQRLNGAGRVVLRPSGTEPVIRVMVEGRDEALVRQLVKELAASVVSAAA
jgi:phosphoglucosamine mutase